MADPDALDFRELDGGLVAFIGVDGSHGVLQFREGQGWLLHAAGSVTWDALHQETYRQFRGDRVSAEEIRARGIALPEIPEADSLPPLRAWSENFRAQVPLETVPRPVRWRVEAASGTKRVYLVLEEDLYESSFGDGRFLYPVAAFWEVEEAHAFAAAKNAGLANSRPSHTVREVRLRMDHGRGELKAELAIEVFEHYSINDVIRLLHRP
ncbi:MAG: hypothetical protein FD180_2312 [Planctomycetota bacterium]|nr:MAG: hypothetical protein FD180_2312 [Planctomycetota bacterium]